MLRLSGDRLAAGMTIPMTTAETGPVTAKRRSRRKSGHAESVVELPSNDCTDRYRKVLCPQPRWSVLRCAGFSLRGRRVIRLVLWLIQLVVDAAKGPERRFHDRYARYVKDFQRGGMAPGAADALARITASRETGFVPPPATGEVMGEIDGHPVEMAGAVVGRDWDNRCRVCGAHVSDDGWDQPDLVTMMKFCDGGCDTAIVAKFVEHPGGEPDYLYVFTRLAPDEDMSRLR
jgi:hypothetical protein